jgi:hypothetical protein
MNRVSAQGFPCGSVCLAQSGLYWTVGFVIGNLVAIVLGLHCFTSSNWKAIFLMVAAISSSASSVSAESTKLAKW